MVLNDFVLYWGCSEAQEVKKMGKKGRTNEMPEQADKELSIILHQNCNRVM